MSSPPHGSLPPPPKSHIAYRKDAIFCSSATVAQLCTTGFPQSVLTICKQLAEKSAHLLKDENGLLKVSTLLAVIFFL